MTLPPTPLEEGLARLLGELTSQTLKLDPASHPRLEALAGTRIRFDLLPPALPGVPSPGPRPMLLTVHPDGLDLRPDDGQQAHAVVRGTLPEIAAGVFGGPAGSGKGLRIEGDEAALQSVSALFRDLEPDLAGPLSGLLGREAADNLLGAAEAGLAFLRSAAESVGAGLRQEARSAWVSEDSFNALLERSEDLSLRVDRLAARVRLAEQREQR